MKKLTAVLIAVASVMSIGVASAAPAGVDISAVVSTFQSDAATAIGLIGLAMVTLAGIAVTYKWVKGTFFS